MLIKRKPLQLLTPNYDGNASAAALARALTDSRAYYLFALGLPARYLYVFRCTLWWQTSSHPTKYMPNEKNTNGRNEHKKIFWASS